MAVARTYELKASRFYPTCCAKEVLVSSICRSIASTSSMLPEPISLHRVTRKPGREKKISSSSTIRWYSTLYIFRSRRTKLSKTRAHFFLQFSAEEIAIYSSSVFEGLPERRVDQPNFKALKGKAMDGN